MDKVDDGVPSVLAGTVTSWDPVARVLDVGDQRFRVPASGVKPLGRGAYRVRFRVLSVDGHVVVESEFPFTFGREAGDPRVPDS